MKITVPLLQVILAIAISVNVGFGQTATINRPPSSPVHQLRIYQIFDSNKKAFHARFRDHAMRIMARYNFNIVATWESHHGERAEFVYLLEGQDKEKIKNKCEKVIADNTWADIKNPTRYDIASPVLG